MTLRTHQSEVCIRVGDQKAETVSARYNCIPGEMKNGELQTQMTYEMYDSASDCTGTQPPGFPTTFLSNECVEGSAGAGVYYFVDCSDGMSAQPGWMSFALLSISLVTMMYK